MQVSLVLGERAAALDLLERTPAEPVGGGDVADAAEIAIGAVWRDLRDDPRFKEIIATHRPSD